MIPFNDLPRFLIGTLCRLEPLSSPRRQVDGAPLIAINSTKETLDVSKILRAKASKRRRSAKNES
jgi:hypothetical protein